MPTFQQAHNSYPANLDPQGSSWAGQNSAPHDQSLIAIGPLLNVLWQRKGLIALITAIFVGLAFLYVTITPKTYTANGVIVIDPLQVRVLDSEAALSGIGANSAAIASQVEIIQSRTLVHKVFVDQGFISDPEFAQPRMLSKIFSIFSPPPPTTETKIFNNFWDRLDVQRQGLTYVIDISFTSQSAQKSADIVNAIIAAYMGGQIDQKSNDNAQVSVLLSAQMEGLRAELSAKEAAVEAFKESHNILSVGSGRTLLQSQIEQLSAQLVVSRERARAANNRHLQVGNINARTDSLTSLFEILTDSSPNSLRASYTQSSMALSSLQASLGPRHPNLMVAAAELARLENLIRNEAQTVLTQIKSEKDLAQTNVENAELELLALSSENSQSNQNQVELRDLERQAGATRQVLEQLFSREQETEQLENLQRSDARVISTAVAPILATWPKSTLLLAIAAFFGLALGSATALYLGPKNRHSPPRQFAPNDQNTTVSHAPAQAPQYAPYYAPADYAQSDAPIYHSSELRNQGMGENEYTQRAREYAQTTAPSQSDEAFSSQPEPAPTEPPRIWARRAAGEPYNAPQNFKTPPTNRRTSPAAYAGSTPQNNLRAANKQTQTGITREGFVSELRKRMEQNAQR